MTKMSLVSWDMVCQPKEHEVLGLRRLKEMNEDFLMKLGWVLI